MSPESITEIITAFEALGGEAKEAFVWYMLFSYVPSFVIHLVAIACAFIITSRVVTAIISLSPSTQLLAAFGSHTCWSAEELARACRILTEARKTKANSDLPRPDRRPTYL